MCLNILHSYKNEINHGFYLNVIEQTIMIKNIAFRFFETCLKRAELAHTTACGKQGVHV